LSIFQNEKEKENKNIEEKENVEEEDENKNVEEEVSHSNRINQMGTERTNQHLSK
jgi:hypothetical protein